MRKIETIDQIIDLDMFIKSNIVDDRSLDIYTGVVRNFPEIDSRIILDNLLALKYNPGEGFPKHSHIKISDEHIGDMIIFPPVSILPEPFVGGDLVIYYDDRTEVIKVDNLNEWKAVYLELNIPHEVTPVLSGTRYSFKYDLFND